MKTSDIFGHGLHLQRRRRNAGIAYRRRKILSNWYTKRYIEITRSNELNYGSILEVILKEDKTHE